MVAHTPETHPAEDPVVIKKYANRRLYDTGNSAYVTLANLATMAREGREFVVQDAKTGRDLTRQILAQIILDAESAGEEMLPLGFLRQIAGLYGDVLRSAVPGYLETTMDAFARNHELLRKQVESAIDMPGTIGLDQIASANQEMFQRTLRAFNPFAPTSGEAETSNGGKVGEEADLAELRNQVAAMQKALNRLVQDQDKG